MELVTAGWCAWKWMRLHQTVINVACSDVEISLVLIRLGVTRLKNTEFVYLLDFFGGKWEKGWFSLVWGGIFE